VRTKVGLLSVGVGLLAICSGRAVLADQLPVFNASVLQEGGNSVSGSSTVSTAFSYFNPISNGAGTLSGDEFAAAGPGGLRSSSKVSIFRTGAPGLDSASGPAQASASATFNDFIITGPGGSVAGSANFTLSGAFETTANIADSIGNTLVLGGAQIEVGVSGSMPGMSFSGLFDQQSGANGQGPTGFISGGNGVFAGDSAPTGFTTAMTELPVGTLFSVSLGLGTTAFASWGSGGGAEGELTTVDLTALSDFSNTFTFATTGPVFNLPDGYTVNSVSGDIVNNRFVGGPAATPEPPALIMLGSGLLSLAVFLRRR
jgi:hypothetical protein